MRLAAGLALLPLAACAQDAPAPDPDSLIECALAGTTAYSRACWVEAGAVPRSFIARHPDGGFRRFEWVDTRAGPMLETADGAEPSRMAWNGAVMEIAVGSDRYRFTTAALNHAGE